MGQYLFLTIEPEPKPELELVKNITRIKSVPILNYKTEPTYNFKVVSKIKSEPNMYINPINVPIDYNTRVRKFYKHGISILNL